MNFYIDMDDVVADWMSHATSILNRDWNYGQRIPDEHWRKLQEDPHFYRHLPLKPGARELVSWCQNYSTNNPGSKIGRAHV